MKAKTVLTIIAIIFMLSVFGQKQLLELTFTAVDNIAYVQLDSIKVMNRTQGGDTTLYWPDTVLVLGDPVGIPENSSEKDGFKVFQNYPNPVTDQTTISMYVPFRDEVRIIITDMIGRVVLKSDRVLEKGIHSFKYIPGGGNISFFTAQWRGIKNSKKILHTASNSNRTSSLLYMGIEVSSPHLKTTKDIQNFPFILGDELLYIGYGNALQSGMLDAPEASETYTFQFATNMPCPGTPTVEYEGQVYNTIQIFSQCWLKENLNVGVMIPVEQDMTDNDTIEKYCYDNDPTNCDHYGGLYQWDETMQYSVLLEAQGICPQGWHLPTDEEWKVLAGAADSQFGIGDQIWDEIGSRGFDAGTNLKTISGWLYGGNGTDIFGFSGLPGGYSWLGIFYNDGFHGDYWSTLKYGWDEVWFIKLLYNNPRVFRFNDYGKEVGFSVRCVRNY